MPHFSSKEVAVLDDFLLGFAQDRGTIELRTIGSEHVQVYSQDQDPASVG